MSSPLRGSMRKRRRWVAGRHWGRWLALLALLIQSGLPLAHAALHEHVRAVAALDDAIVAAPTDAAAAVSQPQPAHASHVCPVCQFILALGSFSPPSTIAHVPARVALFVVWPTEPPTIGFAAAASAQARAPPDLI
jgi:hypothetical protein